MPSSYASYSQATNLYAQASTTRGPVASYVSMFDYLIKQVLLARDAYDRSDFEGEYIIISDSYNALIKLRGLMDPGRTEAEAAMHGFYTEIIQLFVQANAMEDRIGHYDNLKETLIFQRNGWASAANLGTIPTTDHPSAQAAPGVSA